jgi:hypothetical protein
MNTSSPKQVSFAETSLIILTSAHNKRDKSKFWLSKEEIYASKIRWAKTIKQVQSMDMSSANRTDASDFMGLERYLSKDIQKQTEENRRNCIQEVVKAQHKYSNHEEFCEFARSKTSESVARSHAVGVFYANRHFHESKFQEYKDGKVSSYCKKHSTRSADGIAKLKTEYKPKGMIRARRKSAVAPCA